MVFSSSYSGFSIDTFSTHQIEALIFNSTSRRSLAYADFGFELAQRLLAPCTAERSARGLRAKMRTLKNKRPAGKGSKQHEAPVYRLNRRRRRRRSQEGGRRPTAGRNTESYFAGRDQTGHGGRRAGRRAVAERAHVAQRGVQAAAPRRRGAGADPDEGARAAAALARHRPGVGRAAAASEATARAPAARGLGGGSPPLPSARPLGTDAGSPTLSRKAAPAPAPAPAAADAAEESERRRRRTRRCPARLNGPGVAAAPAEMTPKLAPARPRRAAPKPRLARSRSRRSIPDAG